MLCPGLSCGAKISAWARLGEVYRRRESRLRFRASWVWGRRRSRICLFMSLRAVRQFLTLVAHVVSGVSVEDSSGV